MGGDAKRVMAFKGQFNLNICMYLSVDVVDTYTYGCLQKKIQFDQIITRFKQNDIYYNIFSIPIVPISNPYCTYT